VTSALHYATYLFKSRHLIIKPWTSPIEYTGWLNIYCYGKNNFNQIKSRRAKKTAENI